GVKESGLLAANKLRSEMKQHLAVGLRDTREELPEVGKQARPFPFGAPIVAVRFEGRGKRWDLGRLLAIVEQLVEGHLQCQRELFESGNGRNGAAVLEARNVRALQAGALFDVSLRKPLFFANRSNTLGKNHGGPPFLRAGTPAHCSVEPFGTEQRFQHEDAPLILSGVTLYLNKHRAGEAFLKRPAAKPARGRCHSNSRRGADCSGPTRPAVMSARK